MWRVHIFFEIFPCIFNHEEMSYVVLLWCFVFCEYQINGAWIVLQAIFIVEYLRSCTVQQCVIEIIVWCVKINMVELLYDVSFSHVAICIIYCSHHLHCTACAIIVDSNITHSSSIAFLTGMSKQVCTVVSGGSRNS